MIQSNDDATNSPTLGIDGVSIGTLAMLGRGSEFFVCVRNFRLYLVVILLEVQQFP